MAQRRLAADQKKARRRRAHIVFLDESGFLLQPVSRRTWAPRGQTPVVYASARHDRLSAIGAISLSPQRRIGVHFQFYDDNIRAPDVVRFLSQLHRQLRRPLVVVLDRWNVHRSAIRRLQETGARWLEAEWLPAYAPELNPVEAMWSCTKHGDLANFLPEDLYDLGDAVVDSLHRQRESLRMKKSYFQTAQLEL